MMGWPKGKSRKAVVHEEPMEPLDGPWVENDASGLQEPESMTREEVIERVMAESETILIPNPVPILPSCAICCFWHLNGEMYHGQCRRFPAHPRANSPYANWPVMAATDWCGEFKAKD